MGVAAGWGLPATLGLALCGDPGEKLSWSGYICAMGAVQLSLEIAVHAQGGQGPGAREESMQQDEELTMTLDESKQVASSYVPLG